jgi:hypothetical protein
MRITEVETQDTPRGGRLRARIVWERTRPERIHFVYRDVPAAAITSPGDAVLASMLIPAMAMGEDITVEAPVSAGLLEGVREIVRINHGWHPRWHATRVEAPSVPRPPALGSEVASLFSGGLDSFHTLLVPREDPVTLLFTIVGFDMRFEKRASAALVLPRLEQAAEAHGRRVVVVDSNAYELGHKYLFRGEHHGGFLAATVLALGAMVRRCYIPGSWMAVNAPPFGSHPQVDPLWSTEALEFVHDGVGVSRVQKGLAIAHDRVVLDHLRVCVRGPDLYNCGRCGKCVTTALTLHAAGTLGRCRTLPPVRAGDVRRTRVDEAFVRPFRELLEHIEEPEIRRAMKQALRLSRVAAAAGPLVDVIRRRRLRARLRLYDASATTI